MFHSDSSDSSVARSGRRLAVLLVIFAASVAAPPVSSADAPMDTLVSAEWLAQHIDEPDLVVLDCTVMIEQNEDGSMRSVSGHAAYAAGHIPGAAFADLMGDLADQKSSLAFALPAPEAFAAAMGALGVGDDSRVVLYDSNGSVWAARVWWMLRWVGFDNAAVLDGGLAAWTGGDRPVSTDSPQRSAKTLTVAVRPNLIADREEVAAAIADDGVHIVDTLPEASYRGDIALYQRPGHIASAINVPVYSVVDQNGVFRPLQELADLRPDQRSDRHITYCGGGIAASANAFVMTRLGFTDVAVYTASLQEWAADPSNPMEVIESTP